MQLLAQFPLNDLSFGQVSYNIIRELWRKNVDLGLFPIGNPDLTAYQPPSELVQYIQESINRRFSLLKRETPCLTLWHLNGSEKILTPNQTLLTFYECSQPTDVEVSIAANQKQTLFSSSYAANKFQERGLTNGGTFFCGFDEDVKPTDKTYFPDRVTWSLIGKYESRKATKQIIQNWIKKYGNNHGHSLNCLIYNPFFKPEENQQLIMETVGGRVPWNVNFLPHLRTNAEMNDLYNATDIDLSGLSRGEGWGLPSFNTTCLGKWSIVANHTSHKDWATEENCVLVEPDGEIDCHDGKFFQKGGPFNQGVFYTMSDEKMIAAFECAEKLAKQKNQKGLDLGLEMTYSRSVEQILEKL